MTPQPEGAGRIHRPDRPSEVEDIVRDALIRRTPLEIRGHGTKRDLGNPMETQDILDLSGLSGIVSYEPEELVLTVRAGTPLHEILDLLASRRQMLAFEPPDLGALLDTDENAATIGGIVAAGLSGPRRLKAGAARDSLLGLRVVSGRAETFVAGGRVVKNVTGYDLPKLMAGSFGTLGVMTELTFKTAPAPETEASLAIRGLGDDAALRALIVAMQQPCEVSGASHLRSSLRFGGAKLDTSLTLLRLEGFAPSIAARARMLKMALSNFGASEMLNENVSRDYWRYVRDVLPFAAAPEKILWRISAAASKASSLVESLCNDIPGAQAFYDWGGALIWLALPDIEAHSSLIRARAEAAGGHAMLFRAPPEIRKSIGAFPPLPPALMALTTRIKRGFDPEGVLNPGRMYRAQA